jgi:hypothetical protein
VTTLVTLVLASAAVMIGLIAFVVRMALSL